MTSLMLSDPQRPKGKEVILKGAWIQQVFQHIICSIKTNDGSWCLLTSHIHPWTSQFYPWTCLWLSTFLFWLMQLGQFGLFCLFNNSLYIKTSLLFFLLCYNVSQLVFFLCLLESLSKALTLGIRLCVHLFSPSASFTSQHFLASIKLFPFIWQTSFKFENFSQHRLLKEKEIYLKPYFICRCWWRAHSRTHTQIKQITSQ